MRTQSRDTSPQAERVLIDLIRKAPITKRFGMVRSLTALSIKLNRQNICAQQPDASEEEVKATFVADHFNQVFANGLRSALKHRKSSLTSDLLDAITSAVEIFERIGVTFYIKGTIATSIYGMQRAAFDVEFVVDLQPEHIDLLLDNLKTIYYVDARAIKEAILSRTSFAGIHFESALKITVFLPKERAFDQEINRRTQQHMLAENKHIVRIASPEDTVLTQLEEYRASGEIADDQWNEVLGVLKVQAQSLDPLYLQQWAKILTIDDLLERAYIDAGLKET